jgi:hypothetical protein
MNSHQFGKDYNKYEFTAVVLCVQEEVNISLKKAFFLCFKTAQKENIDTGFIKIEEIAYNQFIYFLKKNKNYFE